MAPSPEAVHEVRRLVRGAASAVLATAAGGQPFASLVTPAPAPDLSPLLWLSSLAEHTRQLRAEPRCALLYQGIADGPNPQTAPRVTLTGLAEPVPEAEWPALKPRWLARHPYAALYADFADFALWRMRIVAALHVGGFARAERLKAADLLPDAAAVAALAAMEPGILEHMNTDHADAVGAMARALLNSSEAAERAWRMMTVDVDGADLSDGNRTVRLAFPAPVSDAEAVRAALIQATREARETLSQRSMRGGGEMP